MRFRKFAFAAALAFAALAPRAAHAANVGISKIETPDLELLYFDPLQTYLTPYIARAYENSFAFQEKTFGWTPWDKPVVFLTDQADSGNASARAVPNNAIVIKIAPFPTTFETFTAGERFYTIANHELVHVATMDVWNDDDAFWRHFAHGKPNPIPDHPESIIYNYLAAPRANVPRWYLEGSAVYFETWMSGGLGRAQGGYDEMVWRAKVRDDGKFFSPLGLESEGNQIDFQVGTNDYLYGTHFMTWLSYTYSPEKVIEWLSRGKDSAAYYSTQFEKVFGKPLDDAWNDWIAFEHAYQQQNLKILAQYPPTPTTPLTQSALGSVSRSYYDPATGTLIGGFRYPGVIPYIGALSVKDGAVRTVTNIMGAQSYRVTGLAYDPATGTAWYTSDNYAFRNLMQLDLKTGSEKMLISHGRIGDIVFNPADRSLWGLRHLNGIVALVRLNPPYTGWNLIHSFDYGEIWADLDISPDGTLLCATVAGIDGEQHIGVFRIADLMAGNVKEIAALKLPPSFPEDGTFSRDGRYVYATAYYTGVSNVYRLDLKTGAVDAVSNAVTGFFRPVARDDGSLIVYEFTGGGFRPVVIDPKPINDLGTIKFLGTAAIEKHPVMQSYAVGSPARVPLEKMITDKGEYDPQQEMRLDGAYPVIEGYKAHAGIGYYVNFDDPLLFNALEISALYSPAWNIRPGEQYHASIAYHTLYWHLRYWHNDANFYDLFGPTDRSRKGDALLTEYKDPVVYDPPRQMTFTADLNLYSGLDTLPGAQNVHGVDHSILETKLALDFTDDDKSLGAVDNEIGYDWNLAAGYDYARKENFPRLRAGFAYGLPLGQWWPHSSAWIYSSAGIAFGTPLNPLNDFYFGAFGNNFVDNGEVKRYRDYDSFPGFRIDEIGAREFIKSTGEFNFPPIRFDDIGWPSFYLGSLRSAVFGGVMEANPGATITRFLPGVTQLPQTTLEDLGAQLDLNFTVALRLPMTLSVGYAHGFGDRTVGLSGRDEIMASLKIL